VLRSLPPVLLYLVLMDDECRIRPCGAVGPIIMVQVSSYKNPGRSSRRLQWQRRVFDKAVEEDRVAPQRASRCDEFAIFGALCMLGNGERPQFLQLEYLRKPFPQKTIESVLSTTGGPS
jgi:hypothetical protein